MSKDHRRLKKQQEGRVVQQTRKRAVSKSPATPRAGNQLLEAGNTAIANLLTDLSGGKRLDAGVQREMEGAYGADFDNVRIHDDSTAQSRAEDVNATAFTRNEQIFLSANAPSLQSSAGKKLLAHELAHVVQQQRAGAQQTGTVSREGDHFEVAADNAAARAVAGQRVDIPANSAPPAIQRQSTVENVVNSALTNVLSITDDGWAIAGVTLNKLEKAGKVVEKSGEIFLKIAKGDFQGALDLANPKDAEEEKRLLEKFRKLKEKMDVVKPEDFREREEAEKRERREKVVQHESSKMPGPEKRDPKFELIDPDSDTRFTFGSTSQYVVDDFDIGKSTLKTKHKTTLREIADRALSNPAGEIEIVGHTDGTGEASDNQKLSENRAKSVYDYLIGRGVESGKIKSPTGKAATEPLVEEKTKDDRSKNRRVEIRYWTGPLQKPKKGFGFGRGKLKLDPMS
jgi:outer membrane protein OmpA-like peptidoglycan-associated protein